MKNMSNTEEKAGSEHLFLDVVQRLARNMFPGGDRSSTLPSHVFLSRGLLQDVTKHTFQASILPPLRLKLFNSVNRRQVRTLNTVEALIMSLEQCGHGEYFHDYVKGAEGGTNIVARMVDSIKDGGESEDIVIAATNVLSALVYAVPVEGLLSASDALLNVWNGEDDQVDRVSFALGEIASLFDIEHKRNTISTNEQWMSRAYTVLAGSPQHRSDVCNAAIDKWRKMYDSLRNETKVISMNASDEDNTQQVGTNSCNLIQVCDDRATQEISEFDRRIAEKTIGRTDSGETCDSTGINSPHLQNALTSTNISMGPWETSSTQSKNINCNFVKPSTCSYSHRQEENIIRGKATSLDENPAKVTSDTIGDRIQDKLQSESSKRDPISNGTGVFSEKLNERVDSKLRFSNSDRSLNHYDLETTTHNTLLHQKLHEKQDTFTPSNGGLDDRYLSDESSIIEDELDDFSTINDQEEILEHNRELSSRTSEFAALLNSDRDLSEKTEMEDVSDDESNLIVATAINDHDIEAKLPQCEEYDPATRTRFKRRMKKW